MPSKNDRIKKLYDKGYLLTVKNKFYRIFLDKLFDLLLKTDVGKGDITSNRLFKKNFTVKAVIIAKENGIIAGIEEITYLLNKHDIEIIAKKSGSYVKNGEIVIVLKGDIKTILKLERTILNIFQRMSGITTFINNIVKKSKVRIAATRKTLYSYLDKKAVYIGKGLTHRLNLSDGILIKKNHLKYAKNIPKDAIIEVTNIKEALEVSKYKPIAIMFDNMKPLEIKKAIKLLPKNIIFEASGIKDIKQYQNIGLDVISLGSLTKNSHVLDMSLKIK